MSESNHGFVKGVLAVGLVAFVWADPLNVVPDFGSSQSSTVRTGQQTPGGSEPTNEPSDSASKPPTSQAAAEFVIGISIDGLGANAIKSMSPDEIPNLTRLAREGASTLNARSDKFSTKTLPNHTTMITCLEVTGPNGHKVTENDNNGRTIHQDAGRYITSIFDKVHDAGGYTAFYGSKKTKFEKFNNTYDADSGAPDKSGKKDNGTDKIDTFKLVPQGEVAKTFAADQKKLKKVSGFVLLHLGSPDENGHKYGYGSKEFKELGVKPADAELGEIMETVETDPDLAGRTAIILTADHGGHGEGDNGAPKDHGAFTEVQNYTIPYYVWGAKGVLPGGDLYKINKSTRKDPGTRRVGVSDGGASGQPIRGGDMANQAAKFLGLKPIKGCTINPKQDLLVG